MSQPQPHVRAGQMCPGGQQAEHTDNLLTLVTSKEHSSIILATSKSLDGTEQAIKSI